MEITAFAYTKGTLKEVARKFEEQVWVQREQLDLIRAQKESISALKQMLSQLLKERKKPKGKTSFKKSKGKKKEGESLSSATLRMKSIPALSPPNLHLKRRITQKIDALILRG